MGCYKSKGNENENLKKENDLLKKTIENQEKMLKLNVLNTRMIILSLSNHIRDESIIKELHKLLDEQEKLIKSFSEKNSVDENEQEKLINSFSEKNSDDENENSSTKYML